jgi:hypothetical protein
MSALCELAAPFVANSAVEGTPVARPFRSHLAGCERCSARHEVMARSAVALRAMEGERYAAPAQLEWRVMSSLEGDLAIPRSWKRPVAVAAALVSMAAAVLIWRLRPRPSS